MTVGELITVLQSMDPSHRVHIEDESNYLNDEDNTEGLFAEIYLERPNATTWLDGTSVEE